MKTKLTQLPGVLQMLLLAIAICFTLNAFGTTNNNQIITNSTAMNNDSTTGFKKVNGINMYYEIHGAGKPLVLIHGGGSTIQTSFGRVIPEFAKHRQVIAVELQGNGHTSGREAPYSFKQDAADVVELLKQLGIPKADMMGFSNGGQTAMQIAMSYPQVVNKLVVASAFTKRSGTFPQFWDFMANASFKDMPQTYKDAYMAIPGNTEKGLHTMHDKSLHRMQTFTGWSDDEIKTIKAPTLIMNANQDVGTLEHAVEMTHLITGSKLAMFPGGHGGYLGEATTSKKGSKVPQLTAALVEEFLDE